VFSLSHARAGRPLPRLRSSASLRP
jgi:hypothetical protein